MFILTQLGEDILGRGSNIGQGSDNTACVEGCAREDGWAHEEEGTEGSSLACIESLMHMSVKL